ncbi:MAG: hypothetical protein H6551_05755 [Chitinophagales bacterium]|nr:hypothetical protein [Chitinophagaceae bacterium]MCB9064636.1 hypothetical protein [Chitinophagales bacterium]
MRVLVIGREISDFLCPLFRSLKEKGYVVDVLETRSKDQLKQCADSSFDNVLDIPLKVNEYSKAHIVSSLLSAYFFKKLLNTANFTTAVREAILYKKLQPVISGYDAVHIFFISKELFNFYDAIASAKKLIVSFWGSDILQSNNNFDYNQHSKLIDRADAVTVHQKEMREIFLSKFGREKFDKVSEMLVVNDVSFLNDFINAIPDKDTHIKSFKAHHNIEDSKRIVAIGHSGHTIDDHVKIIKSLLPYKTNVQERICLVLPMTYGCDSEAYYEEVAAACEELGVQYVVLKKFLTKEQMIELRLASEILLRLSKFDAFSLSLCETLCAGNIAITGSWLPYSKLRGNNVYYEEVYDIDDTGERLLSILDNYDLYKERCVNNPRNVMKVFEEEKSVDKLQKVYSNA